MLTVLVSGWMLLLPGVGPGQPAADSTERDSIATALGRTITQQDLERCVEDFAALDAVGLCWWAPEAKSSEEAFKRKLVRIKMTDWLLLKIEADHAQVPVIEASEAGAFLAEQGIDQAKLAELAGRHSLTPERMLSAVGDLLRIRRSAQGNRAKAHERTQEEIVLLGQKCFETVEIEACVFDASRLLDPNEAVSEAEAREQYERYKQVEQRKSPDGFGYAQSWSVVVESIALDLYDAAGDLEVTPQEVRAYYDAHSTRFRSADGQGVPSFEEVSDDAELAAKVAKSRTACCAAMRQAIDELRGPWESVPVGADGFKDAPPATRTAEYFKSAARRLEEKTGLPFTYARSGWINHLDLSSAGDLGRSFRLNSAGKRVWFKHIPGQVRGLVRADDPAAEFALGLFEPSNEYAFTMGAGEPEILFVYRIVDARDVAVPTFEAAKNLAAADVRIVKAVERTKARLAKLAERAEKVGLAAAWTADASLLKDYGDASTPFRPQAFPCYDLLNPAMAARVGRLVVPTTLPNIGSRSGFLSACFDLEPRTKADDPRPILTYELRRERKIVVAELLGRQVPPPEEYKQYRSTLRERLSAMDAAMADVTWYHPISIRGRTRLEVPGSPTRIPTLDERIGALRRERAAGGQG